MPPWGACFCDREGFACRGCLAAPERNRIKHTNEIVSQYMHWLDDEVFTECPTWADCERAEKIPRPLLEQYFGKETTVPGMGGPGNYEQSAKYGVGRRVLCNILEGTESEDSIAEALNTLPPRSGARFS